MKKRALLFIGVTALTLTASATQKSQSVAPIQEVSFTQVHLNDDFWMPRIEINRTVSIPSIGLELPLWDGAGVIELRYGAGRMPLSCEAGCPGNLVIFGHRMRRYGSIFNRLGEVSIGDTVTVTRNGSSFSYIVDQIVTIEPSEISYYISREDEGDACAITLITCTPVGVGTQRLLVIGHLQGS